MAASGGAADAAKPGDPMARAAALFGAGNLKEAWSLCDAILRRDARHFYALHLAAAIAARRGEWEECLRLASRALEVQPRHPEVLANRGTALRMLNRFDEALGDHDRALAVSPRSVEALNNRGVALAALNRHAEAIESYSRALELNPDYHRARYNRALSRLVLGDFDSGWADHEARWHGSDVSIPERAFPRPRWTGREDLRGKTILLHAEQGLGDGIHFSRYARLVRERGARVLLEAYPPLKSLLAQLPYFDEVVPLGRALPPFDYHAPLVSLPLIFATRLETIPPQLPALEAPPAHLEKWRARLGESPRLRVGLAWSGSTTLRNDRNRSIALARFDGIRDVPASFFALQKDIRETDRAALEGARPARHFEDELVDFRDTAALVALMDVVITVDTSIAHLAGAMGKPVWILLPFSPDWRWLLDRDDSPWYPSARLFRQPRPGDWDTVLRRVAAELRFLASPSR
jgi:tetratricopeptide (TPR) repeat protein